MTPTSEPRDLAAANARIAWLEKQNQQLRDQLSAFLQADGKANRWREREIPDDASTSASCADATSRPGTPPAPHP